MINPSYLLIIGLISTTSAFDSTIKYGCKTTHCSIQLVVPREVAQYIDETQLASTINSITTNIQVLNTTVSNFGSDEDTSAFTNAFNANWTIVNTTATTVDSDVRTALTNSQNLLASAQSSNYSAQNLLDAISCFKNSSLSSYTCFTAPTTVAPSTAAPTTVVGSTTAQDSGTTVPFTGTTQTPGTGTTVVNTATTQAGPSTTTGGVVPSAATTTQGTADASTTTAGADGSTSTAADASTTTSGKKDEGQ